MLRTMLCLDQQVQFPDFWQCFGNRRFRYSWRNRGSITMASASTITPSGTITLLADENVVLHGLTTTNATGSAVAVTSTNGSITEAGGTTEITANAVGAVTTLTARVASAMPMPIRCWT